ncbi:hypothetical protein OIY81_2997, partial [Cryptosporidium canis]
AVAGSSGQAGAAAGGGGVMGSHAGGVPSFATATPTSTPPPSAIPTVQYLSSNELRRHPEQLAYPPSVMGNPINRQGHHSLSRTQSGNPSNHYLQMSTGPGVPTGPGVVTGIPQQRVDHNIGGAGVGTGVGTGLQKTTVNGYMPNDFMARGGGPATPGGGGGGSVDGMYGLYPHGAKKPDLPLEMSREDHARMDPNMYMMEGAPGMNGIGVRPHQQMLHAQPQGPVQQAPYHPFPHSQVPMHKQPHVNAGGVHGGNGGNGFYPKFNGSHVNGTSSIHVHSLGGPAGNANGGSSQFPQDGGLHQLRGAQSGSALSAGVRGSASGSSGGSKDEAGGNLEFLPSIKLSSESIDIGNVSKQKLQRQLSELRRRSVNSENIPSKSQQEDHLGFNELNNGYSGVLTSSTVGQGIGSHGLGQRYGGVISSLQAELLALKKEYSQLEKQYKQELLRRSDLEQLERTIKDQKLHIRELQNELSDEKRRSKTREMSLRNKNNSESATNEQWKDMLARSEQERRQKQTQLTEKEAECAKLMKQIKGLNIQIEEMREAEMASKGKLSRMESELSTNKDQAELIKRLSEENKDLSERLDRISNELSDNLYNREFAMQEIKDLKRENQEITEKMNESDQTVKQVQESIELLTREKEDIVVERDRLRGLVDEKAEENSRLATRIEEFEVSTLDYRSRLDSLELDNRDKTLQLEALRAEHDSYKTRESGYIKQLEEKTQTLDKLKRELDVLRKERSSSIGSLEDRIKMLDISKKKSEEMISELTRKNDELLRRVHESNEQDEERDEIRAKNAELMELNRSLQEQIDDKIRENQNLLEEIQLKSRALEDGEKDLRASLAMKEEIIVQLNKDVAHAQEKIESARRSQESSLDQINEYLGEIESIRQEREALQNQVQDLSLKCSKFENARDYLESKLVKYLEEHQLKGLELVLGEREGDLESKNRLIGQSIDVIMREFQVLKERNESILAERQDEMEAYIRENDQERLKSEAIMKDQLDELGRILSEKEEAIEAAQREKVGLEALLQEQQGEVCSIKLEKDDMIARLIQEKKDLESEMRSKDEYLKEVAREKEEVEVFRNKLSESSSENQLLRDRIAKLESTLSSLNSENNQLSERIQKLELERDSCSIIQDQASPTHSPDFNSSNAKQMYIQSLQNEINELRSLNSDLAERLSELEVSMIHQSPRGRC